WIRTRGARPRFEPGPSAVARRWPPVPRPGRDAPRLPWRRSPRGDAGGRPSPDSRGLRYPAHRGSTANRSRPVPRRCSRLPPQVAGKCGLADPVQLDVAPHFTLVIPDGHPGDRVDILGYEEVRRTRPPVFGRIAILEIAPLVGREERVAGPD